MSLSSRAFALGLGGALPFVAGAPSPEPEPGPSILTTPLASGLNIRPAVFAPFGSAAPAEVEEPEAAESLEDTLLAAELVESEPEPEPPDFEEIKAEAWGQGFQEGYEAGQRMAAEEQQGSTAQLAALLYGFARETEQFVRSLEDDVVELALAVAEKVIAREVQTDRDLVVNVVRAALDEIHDATEIRIRVHPDDHALLETRWQEMLPRSVAQRSELLADELIERGGCIVETRIGYVDGQLKTRLNQVVTGFQAVMDGEPV